MLLGLAAPAQAQPDPTQPPPGAPPAATPAPLPSAPPATPPAPPPSTPPPADTGRPSLIAPPTDPSRPPPQPQATQGAQGAVSQRTSEVFSEEWWSHTRPVFELHGLYRLRAELFHNFALGRTDEFPESGLWAPPTDYGYTTATNKRIGPLNLCGDNPTDRARCNNKTQSGANMRFRLNPELHVSDSLRILSQIDLLDNLVLGSTPNGYYNTATGQVGGQSPYAPRSIFSNTAEPPTPGQNSTISSLAVKRVWGEYMTPVGLLRFGRQPNHWGLGMLHNAGDGFDSDWQSTIDRVMFVTGIKSLDLYFGGMWDFPNEGATSARYSERQGQPYDLGQLDDVSQYGLMVMRKRNPDMARQELAEGKVVFNGGVYALYRNQFLANDTSGDPANGASLGQSNTGVQNGLTRRWAWTLVPDVWAQIRYRKLRFEVEMATVQGSIESTSDRAGESNYDAGDLGPNGWKIRQYMLTTQTEFRAIEDRLRVQFGFGWASGDSGIQGIDALSPKGQGLASQPPNDRTFSMASFHPDYRVDLILFRNILTRVQGAYYFKPQVDYDFTRSLNGQKFGGGAAILWSRASEFTQAPGHKRDLGVELDFQLYYQSKDGSLNDDPDRMGGFFTMLQYGVLFPLGGLGYQSGEVNNASVRGVSLDTGAAHVLRWYMGIMF